MGDETETPIFIKPGGPEGMGAIVGLTPDDGNKVIQAATMLEVQGLGDRCHLTIADDGVITLEVEPEIWDTLANA